MKLHGFLWPSWLAKIWNPAPPALPPAPHADDYNERVEQVVHEARDIEEHEEAVIYLGDHSHDLEPPESK
jgi:hypothetical protein